MKIVLIPIVMLTVFACSTETRQLFFDIQPPTAEELAKKSPEQKDLTVSRAAGEDFTMNSGMLMFPAFIDENAPPPAIEELMDWEQAEEMLPKDDEDNVDWSAALRQGLIRPRTGPDRRTLWMTSFQWDFVIRATEDEEEFDEDSEEEGVEDGNEADAYFPHSAHTQWLSCKNCHMTIYPFRRNPATMEEMEEGKSCGVCHGEDKVAFSLETCVRCHLNME